MIRQGTPTLIPGTCSEGLDPTPAIREQCPRFAYRQRGRDDPRASSSGVLLKRPSPSNLHRAPSVPNILFMGRNLPIGDADRPALQRLLADLTVGRVDTMVVYKID